MKTKIFTVLASTAALALTGVASAVESSGPKASVQVSYNEPEHFTDFRMTEFYRASDAEALQSELTRTIERSASSSLPPGYTLAIRFTDIDLAGDVNPFQRLNMRDVREYRSVYPPRLKFDYTVTNPAGETVLSGSETLTDLAYDMQIRMPDSDYTRVEGQMMRDFVRDVGHKLAKGDRS